MFEKEQLLTKEMQLNRCHQQHNRLIAFNNNLPLFIVLFVILCIIVISPKTTAVRGMDGVEQNNFDQHEKTFTTSKLILSRKRRYLLFPEGTSFQLVYDGIIGVVDYTNYLILGITVALAWELPSKPPSEILDDLRQGLEDGTLGLQRRNDSTLNITYIDDAKKNTIQTYKPKYIHIGKMRSYGGHKIIQPKLDSIYTQNNRNNKLKMYTTFRSPIHKNLYYSHNYRPKASENYNRYNDARLQFDRTGWRRKSNYNYSNHKISKYRNPFNKWTRQKSPYGLTSWNDVKYPWWNLASRPRPITVVTNRLDNGSTPKNYKQQQRSQQHLPAAVSIQHKSKGKTTATFKSRKTPRKHRIYPVFGKRSTPIFSCFRSLNSSESSKGMHRLEKRAQQKKYQRLRRHGIVGPELSKIEASHVRHHRVTRQALYEKIGKYLNKLGLPGHYCVLRALCETGQKSDEQVPGTFVGELMRTIFTLPEPVENDRHNYHEQGIHNNYHRYDAANAFQGNCKQRYQYCKKSLWEAQFIR